MLSQKYLGSKAACLCPSHPTPRAERPPFWTSLIGSWARQEESPSSDGFALGTVVRQCGNFSVRTHNRIRIRIYSNPAIIISGMSSNVSSRVMMSEILIKS